MGERELEHYLYEHIPLSLAMQISVIDVRDDGVTLRAPLAPNINHTNTIFGGSASAVAILAAWSKLTRFLYHTLLCRMHQHASCSVLGLRKIMSNQYVLL